MDATVKLTPTNATAAGWTMKLGNVTSTGPDYPVIDLPRNSGSHVITFDIEGANDIKFSQDPIWVQPGQKPNGKANSKQMPLWKVQDQGKQLVVANCNDVAGKLHYQLNFTGHDPLDPVIENGGGIKPIFGNSAVVLLTAAVAVALTLLAAKYIPAVRRLVT